MTKYALLAFVKHKTIVTPAAEKLFAKIPLIQTERRRKTYLRSFPDLIFSRNNYVIN